MRLTAAEYALLAEAEMEQAEAVAARTGPGDSAYFHARAQVWATLAVAAATEGPRPR
jgi:hypothetical protein